MDYSYQTQQRLLQNFNRTPDNDRESGLISVGFLLAVILLGFSMFLCNILVMKFCPQSGALASNNNRNNTAQDSPSNNDHGLPYSSEIRQVYLETALKSQEYCDKLHPASKRNVAVPTVNAADLEQGILEEAVKGGDEDTSIQTNCMKQDSTIDDRDCYSDPNYICSDINDDDDVNKDDDDTLPQCLICFEQFVNGDAVTTHCTNKSYHRHCIMEWLMKHDNCPYCRRLFFPAMAVMTTTPNTTTISDTHLATVTPTATTNTTSHVGTQTSNDNLTSTTTVMTR